jgi:lipopolysaccharide transport system permease protein
MNTTSGTTTVFTEAIRPNRSLLDLRLKEVWDYRDLLIMFVRRDFVAGYKQTILGPLWFFIQPILTTIMFTFVFGKIAQISTDGQPKVLFYLAGLTIWNYFSECFNRTSNVFVSNAGIFGKVYFPRLITPLAIITSGLLKFGVQFILFLFFFFYYYITMPETVKPGMAILLVPVLVLMMAFFAIGVGMIVSALTTKYRDLTMLVSFGVTLLMYATPIIYPVNAIPAAYKRFVLLNPFAPIVETFRYAFLGSGEFSWVHLSYSFVCMLVLLVLGILVFNRVERTFMDTV